MPAGAVRNATPRPAPGPERRILSGAAFADIARDRDIVLYCHSGARSGACLRAMRSAGYERVRHLGGGITAWVSEIAPSLLRY